YGANFLAPKPPNGAGMPRRAIELAEYGIRNNPNEWKLYYQLGFIHYMELRDYAAAADAFARGSRVPNAHPWLKLMAAQMAEHAGDLQTARMMWTTMYQSTHDQSIKANAAAHLRALQVDEDVSVLETLVARYRDRTGRLPVTFSDLEAAGFLRGTPVDPLGHPYKLLADGHIVVRVPDDLPFLKKGIPPGYVHYAWDNMVNTTSAIVGWRSRLLGMFHSPYQPTEPALFHEMMDALKVDFREFTFIDVGSGKGRVLLMAADYPFRRIVGIELLPELHHVALDNLRQYQSHTQECVDLQAICGDARTFPFPAEPTVLYLFNPLPEEGLSQVILNLERSLRDQPRPLYLLYHNPLLEHVLANSVFRR